MGETIAVDNNISANVQNILMNLVTSHQYPGLLWFYGVDYTFSMDLHDKATSALSLRPKLFFFFFVEDDHDRKIKF